MPILITGGYGLVRTLFLATGVTPSETQLIITFNSPFDASGPAERVDGYSVTLDGPGLQVTVLSVTLNEAGGTITLGTTPHTAGGDYTVHLPEQGLLSTLSTPSAFSGPFSLDYEGVVDPVLVNLVRSVDARSLDIIFSRRVNQVEAEIPANYAIDPTLAVLKAQKVTDFYYRLTTAQQVPSESYDITISNIHGV